MMEQIIICTSFIYLGAAVIKKNKPHKLPYCKTNNAKNGLDNKMS